MNARPLFATGARSYGNVFVGAPFPPVPLDDEFLWTAHWLKVRAADISAFRGYSERVQRALGQDKFDEALHELAKLTDRYGHSFWLVELETAIIQYYLGTSARQAYISSLRKVAADNSVEGFLAYLFGDRNDETQTHDAFYSRSSEQLPRVETEEWLRSYLFYRLLQHYDPVPNVIAQNLRNERLSSIFDLYETFVESALTVATSFSLKAHRAGLVRALDLLVDIQDPRLARIHLLAGGGLANATPPDAEAAPPQIPNEWQPIENLALWREHRGEAPHGQLQAEAFEVLSEVWDSGSRAEKAVGRALKLGLNFKSLDVGVAIASQADKLSSKADRTLLVAPGALLIRLELGWEEIVGAPFDLSIALLEDYSTRSTSPSDSAAKLQAATKVPPDSFAEIPALGQLWLTNYYDFKGNYRAAASVMDWLVALGGRWAREATRSRFVLAYSRGNLDRACQILTAAVVEEHEFYTELPVSEMFWGRKWNDFKPLDPVRVGIASYLAFDAPATSAVKHICTSACKAVARSGLRELIESLPPADMPEERRKEIAYFFATVWSDDALGRTGLFESSQEVRSDRIKVLQSLLAWDAENAASYVAEVKELTVHETLWLGLKHLNETRVFVNETAITRWAEKELSEDYARWKDLAETAQGTGEIFTEGKILQYLSAPVDSQSGIQDVKSITAADAVLLQMINRLLVKFLTDPTDGLNCYLSLRVRHGTMTGTLSGPAESADILVPADEPEEEAVERLVRAYNISTEDIKTVHGALSNFSSKYAELCKELVNERVQIFSGAKPNGLLYATIEYSRLTSQAKSIAKINFSYFVYVCYSQFWQALRRSLDEARGYFKDTVQSQIEEIFSELLEQLHPLDARLPRLHSAVQAAATLSVAQCGVVASWFQLPNHLDAVQQVFKIDQAIEVARQATTNVYPTFEPEVRVDNQCGDLPISGVGLSAIVDSLFVMLQNAATRSGLSPVPWVSIRARRRDTNIFILRVESPISDAVRDTLRGGRLASLQDRYSNTEEVARLVDQESGSGLPKLWRMTRTVEPSADLSPLSFGLDADSHWYVQVAFKLFAQDGVFHAS